MKVSYYPGCSLHGTAKEYDQSMRAVSCALGIELKELDDWSCCGASSAHATNFKLSMALPARDLVKAEQKGMDLMVPCAACFNRLKTAQHHLKDDPALRGDIECMLGARYQGTINVRNPIDIIFSEIGVETLVSKVKRPLRGLKPVSYYGCLLLRPPEVCRYENYENPVQLDKIMAALGADVKQWSFKTDCCGGSLSISRTDLVVGMVDKLMTMAREAGANCVAVACPLCMANLDMRASNHRKLPVFYFTELIGVALGLEGPANWAKLHNLDPTPLLEGLGLL